MQSFTPTVCTQLIFWFQHPCVVSLLHQHLALMMPQCGEILGHFHTLLVAASENVNLQDKLRGNRVRIVFR